MTQAPAPDDAIPTRLNAGVGAVLGVAIVLLLAMLPGAGPHGARPISALSAAHADQPALPAASRIAAARAEPGKARPDFGGTPLLLAGALAAAFLVLTAASLRPSLARAEAPRRRSTTARARAPPRA